MRESVVYQDILQKGLQQGLQQGRQQGEVTLILRLLNRRFGEVDPQWQERIQGLSIPQLEELSLALLDFEAVTDLASWLDEHQPQE